jgi:hypothetical protein
LELFRQCGIIYFYMWLWNCSDSVALFVLIWDFETVPQTLGTVPKSNSKTNNGTLSEQFESPKEKPVMSHCGNSSKAQ